jgi:hypothetical protein
LREFFSDYANDPQNHFRVTYFKPSDDGQYLITKFYANADGTPPVSHNDIETQKIRFNKDNSTTEAVKAWRDKEVCIANHPDIVQQYNQQKTKYKSIIAYPIFDNNDCAKQVIGVISVTSSLKDFFKEQDILRHKDYIEQFALRLVFEYCKLQSNNNAKSA